MHWTRASLVVLALLALVVAPGTIFAVAAAPDSDLVPVRGFRRLTQTTNDGGVEYLQRAKLTAGDGAEYDYFGYSVSIDGDTIVIGARYDDDKGYNSGSAYVFTRVTAGDLTSGWTKVAKLTAGTDGAANDYFGYSVSIDGDTVVIGAYTNDDPTNSGSAYVFSKYVPPCDASSPPANGTVGDCTSVLESGSTCQPVCDPGYAVSGPSVCENSVLCRPRSASLCATRPRPQPTAPSATARTSS